MQENSVKCGKVRERLPTSTLRRGKVPKGRPARAPTSTADRGTKKNECTKGAGAEGARTLCAGGRRPPLIFSFVPPIGRRGRSPCWTSLGHLGRAACVEVGGPSPASSRASHLFSRLSIKIPVLEAKKVGVLDPKMEENGNCQETCLNGTPEALDPTVLQDFLRRFRK